MIYGILFCFEISYTLIIVIWKKIDDEVVNSEIEVIVSYLYELLCNQLIASQLM